ncbi:hypothetical protein KDW_29890 [Dictyobacter vulcani]|uniref:Uncharacterized protein n=1 Tax=Dictyobacter vulcani TaxID=2607529 RepID=A0A5J4KR46_9CHLR|nr:hypothetical protein [Dictyobacter vulcani]GER88827.1 hypothetical protein KDW_29890 [Dictyobacter vulcani]
MRSKKQIGMYSISVDEEGALQIQAPTLLRPLQLDPQQAQELQAWLSGIYTDNTPQPVTNNAPTPDTTAPGETALPSEAATPASTITTPPAPTPVTPAASPQATAQHIIREAIANAQAQYPASLAPENRDRFIDQITRHPAIRPLMSQGKISFKQIMLWVEQAIGDEK